MAPPALASRSPSIRAPLWWAMWAPRTRLNYLRRGTAREYRGPHRSLLSTYQTSILLGEDTATRIGDRMALRHVGEAQLKGIKDTHKALCTQLEPGMVKSVTVYNYKRGQYTVNRESCNAINCILSPFIII